MCAGQWPRNHAPRRRAGDAPNIEPLRGTCRLRRIARRVRFARPCALVSNPCGVNSSHASIPGANWRRRILGRPVQHATPASGSPPACRTTAFWRCRDSNRQKNTMPPGATRAAGGMAQKQPTTSQFVIIRPVPPSASQFDGAVVVGDRLTIGLPLLEYWNERSTIRGPATRQKRR
jgi:hypothetical protein